MSSFLQIIKTVITLWLWLLFVKGGMNIKIKPAVQCIIADVYVK